MAARLFSELGTDTSVPDGERALAYAELAAVHLSVDRLQDAVTAADLARRLFTESPRALGVLGRIALASGDLEGARADLEQARRDVRVRHDPEVDAAWTELTRANPENLQGQVAEDLSSGLRSWTRAGLEREIELKVVAAARSRSGAPEEIDVAVTKLRAALDSATDTEWWSGWSGTARSRVDRSVARGRLILGELLQRQGDFAGSVPVLSRAVGALADPSERRSRAVAEALLGAGFAALDRPKVALEHLRDGMQDLEAHRGQLRRSESRGRLIGRHGEVYDRILQALLQIQDHCAGSGELAAELVESLRRNALADSLRERGTPDAVRVTADRIAQLERSAEPDVVELAQLRETLRRDTSAGFADAYLPRKVEWPRTQAAVERAHVLTFRLVRADSAGVRGYAVWAAPGSEPVIESLEIEDPGLLDALGLRGPGARAEVMGLGQTRGEPGRWSALGAALLPSGLRREVMLRTDDDPLHLVIVPDGPLSYLPWAILRTDDGRVLVGGAVVQVVPSLDLLATPSNQRVRSGVRGRLGCDVLVHVDADLDPDGEEYAALQRVSYLHWINSVTEVDAAVADRRPAGVYIAAHGDGLGFEQALRLGGGQLSTAAALACQWPPWVLFAACLVARVETAAGEEPLGIAVSCLLGGAHSVIGGLVDFHSPTLARVGPTIASRLLDGAHPARALRDVQWQLVRERSRPGPPDRWAGLACISRLAPL